MTETNKNVRNLYVHNRAKNPNLLESKQLPIYKHSQGFELAATKKPIQQEVTARDFWIASLTF